ncbi:cell division cycle-associated protein 4 [Dunckerocampus dactyliophorus]|uniref:cell division cycle-associated protein 4 n=1 Tax=Dunckerocampus dactyliophorus TaxID=161453 RepID=UPI002404AAC8|nr:cell division cycle-associated protein 4 [Dunckerocampus dactyliophorus]XP_054651859.1 cell division cycle-associated protein 4 [Dunckerocampus dactyliophorus]XP_054651860.1 cell division cycle-associated protein 4 [Dunckerocampus dactyliophorus]XP_054651861.1 cell division cycle-associated protein 4 [Dunckerocampus dactyliophorus]XP_054651862.1 cell division cycle-associated protein 4 [Dunckerocampus dactyliophorus]
MFPKGTKRKFSDSGEEAVSSSGEQGPVTRTPSPSYSLQRQSLLDMSLIKLQLCHMLVEPNLCRSVLIANTVRQIQEEMTQDGTWQIMTQALAAAQCPSDRLVATEVLCRQSDPAVQVGQSPKPYPAVGLDEGYHSEEVVMEGDVDKEVMSALSPVSPQLSTASYLAGPFGMGPCWEDQEEDGECEEDEEDDIEDCVSEGEEGERPEADSRSGEQVFGTFEIKHPPPPPDPALEELFSDVDPSYYELDTVLTGMQSAPKMGPYDLLESLSSHGPPSLSSSASCRSDLNELDHIMEIIVGS